MSYNHEHHKHNGPSVSETTSTISMVSIRIHGMDCAEEVATLKAALKPLIGEAQLFFDVLQGRVDLPEGVDLEAVHTAVARTGMRSEAWTPEATRKRTWWEAHGQTALTAASGVGTILGFITHTALQGPAAAMGSEGMGVAHGVPLPAVFFYASAILAGLRMVAPKALYAARNLRPDMNLLMTLAVAGAILIGEWFEAATVSFLFALSLLLESWSVDKARRAVEKLLSLAPPRVRIRRRGELVEVDPKTVSVGTVFVVLPGERVALDGAVSAGASEVDEAPITGESMPVAKGVGDNIFAGTINGNGVLDARVTSSAEDTVLAQIVRMVDEARKERSSSERWVERFARVYTPVVLAIAAAVMVIPPTLFSGAWHDWCYRGLVFLVIGCPCALVISTPVAVVAGLAAAARHGILVKGGSFLEIPASLQAIALDKTGTLTEGRPRVVDVISLDDHGKTELTAVAACIEAGSDHPIARAVLAYAKQEGIPVGIAERVTTVPGKGATGTVDGQPWWVGSHRWVEERGQETPALHELLAQRSSSGRTAVIVGNEEHVCGVLMLADAVRSDARAAVAALHAAGLHVAMLTGDNEQTAAAVGAEVGVDEVWAELLPEDKVSHVERLEQQVGAVAMIGDGINDAPALARASLGVAMGAMGTDVAVETADVALMTDDLSSLAWLVAHSKRMLRTIRANVVVALGIKAVFMVLTMLGIATLWGAIAADMGASLLVVFNALRLLRDRGSSQLFR